MILMHSLIFNHQKIILFIIFFSLYIFFKLITIIQRNMKIDLLTNFNVNYKPKKQF